MTRTELLESLTAASFRVNIAARDCARTEPCSEERDLAITNQDRADDHWRATKAEARKALGHVEARKLIREANRIADERCSLKHSDYWWSKN